MQFLLGLGISYTDVYNIPPKTVYSAFSSTKIEIKKKIEKKLYFLITARPRNLVQLYIVSM